MQAICPSCGRTFSPEDPSVRHCQYGGRTIYDCPNCGDPVTLPTPDRVALAEDETIICDGGCNREVLRHQTDHLEWADPHTGDYCDANVCKECAPHFKGEV